MDIKTLQAAESILLNKRHNAIALSDKNREILMNNPDFYALYNKYQTTLLSAFKTQNNQSLSNLKSLDNQMNDFANKANLPLNNFDCKACDDTGTTADGKRCECLIRIYRELLINSFDCGKPIANADLSADKIPNCTQQPTLMKLYEKCKGYVNAFPNTNIKLMTFSGNSGLGKTYIVSAIANELIDKDYDVFFCDAYTLNQKFLEHYLGKMENPTAFMQKLYNSDLLVIDDLGSEKMYNKVTCEYIKNLLDMRENKHTLITSNLNVSSIEFKERYGERIHSRINDKMRSFSFIIKGDDLRLTNR